MKLELYPQMAEASPSASSLLRVTQLVLLRGVPGHSRLVRGIGMTSFSRQKG